MGMLFRSPSARTPESNSSSDIEEDRRKQRVIGVPHGYNARRHIREFKAEREFNVALLNHLQSKVFVSRDQWRVQAFPEAFLIVAPD